MKHWDYWEDRIMIALLLLIGVPGVLIMALFAWALLFTMVGIFLGNVEISDGAGAFQIRIVD